MSGEHAADARPALDPQRRDELVRRLEERARLLALPDDLVDRALARCVRSDLRRERGEARTSDRFVAADPQASDRLRAETARGPTTQVTRPPPEEEPELDEEATAKTLAETGQQQAVASGDIIPNGRVVAGYRIERLLGKGGMGQVYRAVQLSVQREVAFKVLSPRLASDRSFRERFLREARAAGRLHHHNLIAVHDVGEANGLMFFSMELVGGGTVKDLIAERGKLELEFALRICAQLLSALGYAHGHGIVHRDIKPDNIMVTHDGAVKVADLGLSRVASLASSPDDSASTQAGTIMGTPHYMSPEQGRDAHAVDHRSDLYSVGATLYHMLCGRTPFLGASPIEVVMKASTEALTFPEPGPPPAVRAFIAKLMAKRPEERYGSAAEALAALERLRLGSAPEPSHSKRVHRIRRRRLRRALPMLSLALAALVALMIVALVVRNRLDQEAFAHELKRVEALVDEQGFARAVAAADEDLRAQPPGSARAARVQALRDDLQRRWDDDAQKRAGAAIAACDAAVKDRRWSDATKALRLDDEEALTPSARKALDDRRDQLEGELEEMAAKADSHNARDVEGVTFLDRRYAQLFWPAFTGSTASRHLTDPGVMAFTGQGEAELQGELPMMRQRSRDWRFELREVLLRVRLPNDAKADERWRLQLGSARIEVTAAGATLTSSDNATARTTPLVNGEVILHLRREQGGFVLGVRDMWTAAVPDQHPRLSWSLAPGHTAEVVVHPAVERIPLP